MIKSGFKSTTKLQCSVGLFFFCARVCCAVFISLWQSQRYHIWVTCGTNNESKIIRLMMVHQYYRMIVSHWKIIDVPFWNWKIPCVCVCVMCSSERREHKCEKRFSSAKRSKHSFSCTEYIYCFGHFHHKFIISRNLYAKRVQFHASACRIHMHLE